MFNGGKKEENETIEETAIRETKEESGLNIKNLKLIKQQKTNWEGNKYNLNIFIADIKNGKLVKSREHEILNFFSLDEIKKMRIEEFSFEEIKNIAKNFFNF